MNTQKNEARKKKFNKKSTVLRIVILILIIVSFSTLYLRCAWHRYQEAAVSETKMLANSVAALIHPEEIEHLTGGEEDRMKPEYLRLQHELSELAHTKNRVRAAYLTAEREGGSIFLLDSEPGSSNAGDRPSSLKAEEKMELKKHSTTGYRILSLYSDTVDIAKGALDHHEHWNGSGYPKGLNKEEISMQGRVISVAEAYDFRTNPYSKAKQSHAFAMKEIREYAGIKYDPRIVEALGQVMEGRT